MEFRVLLNLLYGRRWPWIHHPSASVSQELGFQSCVFTLCWTLFNTSNLCCKEIWNHCCALCGPHMGHPLQTSLLRVRGLRTVVMLKQRLQKYWLVPDSNPGLTRLLRVFLFGIGLSTWGSGSSMQTCLVTLCLPKYDSSQNAWLPLLKHLCARTFAHLCTMGTCGGQKTALRGSCLLLGILGIKSQVVRRDSKYDISWLPHLLPICVLQKESLFLDPSRIYFPICLS